MGKSKGRKKKGGGSNRASVDNSGPTTNDGVSLKRAHEMKEEGNRKFQNKDYSGALEHYDNALRLTPKTHPDRALFHSNRAACLMQMKPINYETVIVECTMALEVQPQFLRPLLRRARAFEALGKYGLTVQDVKALLAADPTNSDALQFSQRLKIALVSHSPHHTRSSAAAIRASAVRGGPIPGLGPCLPARPGPSNVANSALPKPVLKPAKSLNSRKENQELFHDVVVRFRPLKLVYDHDIRLAQMPVNCSFRVLRESVSKRFPWSKSVLIKYKDNDGDSVTITSSEELRFAESTVDSNLVKHDAADKSDSVGMLRLNIVEVSPEKEPPLLEEEEVEIKGDENENRFHCSPGECVCEEVEKNASKEKADDTDCKEMEMDDWLFEFAQLFRSHVGVDQDVHVDLHELGMEFCSEALEETVTSEEAQCLLEKTASKFQEVAVLAFFNWGNVHMCAARKRVTLDESVGKEVVTERLQVAYDWVKEKYCLAKEKYEQALLIKPDFYEGLLALGQQQFEMAKLHWSFPLAKNIDLSAWDPAETLQLFNGAEENIKAATDMWEKLEEQRINELKDPNASKQARRTLEKKKKTGR
ncbi:hypothetical protein VNO77_01803 [Canavalia gladiata]|uniref:PB1 domain-containing protein n=1 Tax=Canavalia gladiata TaxID=3824 RepID=A0AAN9RAM6_CANGL